MGKLAYNLVFIIGLFFFVLNASAQGETDNWLMGQKDKWIKFENGVPELVCPNICLGDYSNPSDPYNNYVPFNYFFWAGWSSSSLSDKDGNLLFYSNGSVIYHHDLDTLVTTVSSVFPAPSESCQSLFIPRPGNKNRFYYFTPQGSIFSEGVKYLELDISLNSGLGDTVGCCPKTLIDSTVSKVTGTYHKNQKDIWVLTHGMNSNVFYAFLITDNGVSLNPILSSVGMNHGPLNGSEFVMFHNGAGQMKFSPDGRKLLVAIQGLNKVQIFNFDNESGIVSNPITVDIFAPYAVEFSPDGTIGYIGSFGSISPPVTWLHDTNAVYQLDLLTGDSAEIVNSIYKVRENTFGQLIHNYLQLASNGIIYTSKAINNYQVTLDGIVNPNGIGQDCGFVNNIFYKPLYSSNCITQLRNLPSFFPPYLDRNILFSGTCYGDSTLICTQTNTNFDSIRWEFNDPLTGLISIPNQDTIYHQFSGFGPYEIRLKRYRNAGHLDVTKKMLYIYTNVSISLPEDTLLCEGQFISISAATDSCEFDWVNDYSSDTIQSDTITIAQGGQYWPIITNFDNYCGLIDSIEVHFKEDNLNLGPDNFNLCSNPGYLMIADVYDTSTSYNWNTGDTISCLWVNADGVYSVSVQQGNCIFQDTIALAFDDSLLLAMPDSIVLCDGTGIWLSAGDFNASYLWSPTGETGMDIWIESAGIYSVTVSNGCGDFADSTEFIQPVFPLVDLGQDTAICFGSGILLDASFPHSNFSWNTGSANSIIETMQAGLYAVTVSNICGSASDSIQIQVDDSLLIELGADTALCKEANFILQASQEANQYLWSTGDSSQMIAIQQTGEYWLQAGNACNTSTDTVFVTINENTFAFATDTLSLDSNQVLQLNAPAGYQSYRWSTSDTVQTIWISNPGEYWLHVTDSLGCTASDTIVILPYISSPEQAISTIRVYPNPTTGELFLEGLNGGERIEVYDILGKRLSAFSTSKSIEIILLNQYPKGIYLIIIQNGHQRVTQKVLII